MMDKYTYCLYINIDSLITKHTYSCVLAFVYVYAYVSMYIYIYNIYTSMCMKWGSGLCELRRGFGPSNLC